MRVVRLHFGMHLAVQDERLPLDAQLQRFTPDVADDLLRLHTSGCWLPSRESGWLVELVGYLAGKRAHCPTQCERFKLRSKPNSRQVILMAVVLISAQKKPLCLLDCHLLFDWMTQTMSKLIFPRHNGPASSETSPPQKHLGILLPPCRW